MPWVLKAGAREDRSSPESHVADSRCSRVTGGGEAEYPFRGGGANRQSLPLRESCSVVMLTRKGQGRAELLSKREGHGRGEDSGDAASTKRPCFNHVRRGGK